MFFRHALGKRFLIRIGSESSGDDLVLSPFGENTGEGSVIDERAVANDEDPFAEALDVLHVMGCEDHRRSMGLAILQQETANRLLGREIEPDRGLVQEHHFGLMEKGGDQLKWGEQSPRGF